MKRVIFAILAVAVAAATPADAGDRGRHNGGNHGGNHAYHPGHPGQHPPRPIPHPRPRPRPPVFVPPVFIPPPVYQQPYYPQVRVIHCGSVGYRPSLCYTGLRIVRRIDILRQYSHSPCIPGQTALLQGNSVLVTNGCEADFRVEGNY